MNYVTQWIADGQNAKYSAKKILRLMATAILVGSAIGLTLTHFYL